MKNHFGDAHREIFFKKIINLSQQKFIEKPMNLNTLLKTSQEFNLLCANEVEYFQRQEFKDMPAEVFFEQIQNRLIYHRHEELKIKTSLVKKGGFLSLFNGSRVQGTVHVKGLQPDYIIDSSSPEIREFLYAIKNINKKDLSTWEKIEKLGQLLRSDYIEKTEYDDSVYLDLLKKYRDKSLEIPLSEYLKIKRGVCREISMLTTLGLNALDIESYYYYAKVKTVFNDVIKEEDHAIVVSSINGQLWTIDNYFKMFHGHPLEHLHSPHGVTCKSGTQYEKDEILSGTAFIYLSRLYPETRHNPSYSK